MKPGPRPGTGALVTNTQTVINNGRPQESIKLPRSQSASPIPVAPPIPFMGFRVPWPGMNNPGLPQPQAIPGKPAFNSLTGEWFNG